MNKKDKQAQKLINIWGNNYSYANRQSNSAYLALRDAFRNPFTLDEKEIIIKAIVRKIIVLDPATIINMDFKRMFEPNDQPIGEKLQSLTPYDRYFVIEELYLD